MKLKDLIIGVIVGMVIGITVCSVSIVMADALDRVREKKESVFLYVYDDKTQLWNRARNEDLKNAACEKLHTYIVETE